MKNRQVFIIAEAGVNHNGCVKRAMQLIDAAVEAGADAMKFQTFQADTLVLPDVSKAEYQRNSTKGIESQQQMLSKLQLDHEEHFLLSEYCRQKDIQFLSSPFDLDSLKYLATTLLLPTIKIASGELTNAPLLLKAAQLGQKTILSTGMSTLGDIEQTLGVLAFGYLEHIEGIGTNMIPSISAFRQAYYTDRGQQLLSQYVTLLHCTTEYPAPYDEVNLRSMDTLRQCFGLEVGYSDHTLGIAVSIAAAARGARVIEKHLTLDRTLPGPDHQASLEPDEFQQMVQSIRQVEQALGHPYKKPVPSELSNLGIVRKSLVAARNIQKGEKFTPEKLTVMRPGTGISPYLYWEMLGKQAHKPYRQNEMIE